MCLTTVADGHSSSLDFSIETIIFKWLNMVLIENKQLSTTITLTVVLPLRCLITSIEFLILELIFLVVFLHNLQSSLLFLIDA
jgi:hypothetical protein